jgi:hypothetical protein
MKDESHQVDYWWIGIAYRLMFPDFSWCNFSGQLKRTSTEKSKEVRGAMLPRILVLL